MEIPEREASANQMLSLLEVNATNMLAAGTPRNGDRVRFPLGARMPQMFAMPPPIPKCIMTAFPQAEFEVLRSDLAMAVDSIFAAPNEGQRIPTQTHSRKQSKWCGQAHVAMASRSGVVGPAALRRLFLVTSPGLERSAYGHMAPF
eukprot:s620_g5.t1